MSAFVLMARRAGLCAQIMESTDLFGLASLPRGAGTSPFSSKTGTAKYGIVSAVFLFATDELQRFLSVVAGLIHGNDAMPH